MRVTVHLKHNFVLCECYVSSVSGEGALPSRVKEKYGCLCAYSVCKPLLNYCVCVCPTLGYKLRFVFRMCESNAALLFIMYVLCHRVARAYFTATNLHSSTLVFYRFPLFLL